MKRLAVRRYVCTYRNEPMCCVLEAMPWCVVRLYCVRELQPHYIVAVYGIGSLTSRSFSALRGRAGRGHYRRPPLCYWHRKYI